MSAGRGITLPPLIAAVVVVSLASLLGRAGGHPPPTQPAVHESAGQFPEPLSGRGNSGVGSYGRPGDVYKLTRYACIRNGHSYPFFARLVEYFPLAPVSLAVRPWLGYLRLGVALGVEPKHSIGLPRLQPCDHF